MMNVLMGFRRNWFLNRADCSTGVRKKRGTLEMFLVQQFTGQSTNCEAGVNDSRVVRHHAANQPSKRERQASDRLGHTGLSESLIWDRDDMPSLQQPLSRALGLYFREE